MREIIEREIAAAERFRRIVADKPRRLADRYNAAVLADNALETLPYGAHGAQDGGRGFR